MLVLSRRCDEVIYLTLPDGTRIGVTVVSIRGDNVRLGFTAPDDVIVMRKELGSPVKRSAKEVRS